MTTLAILTAAGSGVRLGLGTPKALALLGGEPLVLHAARHLLASGVVDEVVVTAPATHVDAFAAALVPLDAPRLQVVPGGATRQASVDAGLDAGDASHDVVLVHDAARALAPATLVRRVVAAVRAGNAAVVPALAVTDTVKRVAPGVAAGGGGDEVEDVVETVARDLLRAVQTPQGFERAMLVRAHEHGRATGLDESVAATDDAGLVERLGERVVVVPGDDRAMKVTTPWDLRVAALHLGDGA